MSRLDVVGEVVINPASIAEVSNLHADDIQAEAIVLSLALFTSRRRGGGRGFVERDTRNFLGEKIPNSKEAVSRSCECNQLCKPGFYLRRLLALFLLIIVLGRVFFGFRA